MNTKENRSGEMQPFIPAGNGSKSGEYTFKESYINSEHCTMKDLKQLLTPLELMIVRKYSIYDVGKQLNEAIRNNRLSRYGKYMAEMIITAISKHHLMKDIKIYRGISVFVNEYIELFYKKYLSNQTIEGSVICSTSRSFKRALQAAISKKDKVGLVFETILPKGYAALPIEAIANRKKEKEILITRPKYKIISIEDHYYGNVAYKKIKIQLEVE